MKRLWPFVVALAIFLVMVAGTLWNTYGHRLPGASRMCEHGLGVGGDASCQLGVSTRDSVRKQTGIAQTFQVKAYDPRTRTDLTFACQRGAVVRCVAPSGELVVIAP